MTGGGVRTTTLAGCERGSDGGSGVAVDVAVSTGMAGGAASDQTAGHPLKRPRQTAPHSAQVQDEGPATIGCAHPSWICGPNS
jgi:hypothetical protein